MNFRLLSHTLTRLVLSCALLSSVSTVAMAQTADLKPSDPRIAFVPDALSSSKPSDTISLVGLSPALRGALIDVPSESTSLFNLDFSGSGCFTNDPSCSDARFESSEIGYSTPSYLKLNSKGLGIELTPSASLRFDDDQSSTVVGALVKIGDDLRRDSEFNNNTWYFFAGADAEALTYRPNSASGLTRGNFNLQDRIIVGDAQAGVGYRIGDADLSLSYMRREVSGFSSSNTSDDVSFKEDAATLSFTWRR